MPERAPLLALLRQVRRRLRVLAAVDGAVRGAALGLGALAVALGVARLRGEPVSPRLAVALVAGVALGGAAVLALRRIALALCARMVDGALDNQDRVLSALSFMDLPPSTLVRAAVSDALDRARALTPARVAPARRPRGLVMLGLTALAATVSAVVPARAPAARLDAGAAPMLPSGEAHLRLAPRRLEAEAEEARHAAEEAAVLEDAELGALARELDAAVSSLTDGTLTRGDALERLQALAERASESAGQAERGRDALRAAARALEESAPTRAAGAALAANDAAAAEKALGALAARAAAASAAERNQIAHALEAAAQQAAAQSAGTSGDAAPGKQSQRRLQRDQPGGNPASGPAGKAPDERRLQRLQRDLADTASACRENPEACRERLSQRAGDLPRMAREPQRASALRRLENAARQMRERLRREDLGGHERRMDEKRFMREARGQPGEQGAGGDDARAMAQGDGAGEDDDSDEQEGGSSAVLREGGEGQGSAEDGQGEGEGEGIGSQPGREPLGSAGATNPTRGHDQEAHLRGGSGPKRSQVIEAAAQRGFAHGAYGRVYTDYHAVVEEALEAGAVPEGRRYVVRRYFQLIRPRSAPAGKP